MKKTCALLCFGLLAFSSACSAQTLQEKVNAIVASHRARVGVVIENADGSERAVYQGNAFFPMQSVFKFPIALAVLDKVDRGELRLNQRIFLKKSDLRPNTWSPLRDRYKNGNVYVTLGEIIRTTIKDSDNNGCDILPDGSPLFISVLVSHGKEPKAITEKMIARLSHTAWEHLTANNPRPAGR